MLPEEEKEEDALEKKGQKLTQEQRNEIYRASVQEAGGLYSQLLIIANFFFGGSLIPLAQLSVTEGFIFIKWTQYILVSSYVSFFFVIYLLISIRYGNIEVMKCALEGKKDRQHNIQKIIYKKFVITPWLLYIGIIMMIIFFVLNLF